VTVIIIVETGLMKTALVSGISMYKLILNYIIIGTDFVASVSVTLGYEGCIIM